MGDAFPCSPQGLGIEPGGSRPTSNTELFKPVSIVGGIYSSGLTSHPEKIFRENESNDNRLSVLFAILEADHKGGAFDELTQTDCQPEPEIHPFRPQSDTVPVLRGFLPRQSESKECVKTM